VIVQLSRTGIGTRMAVLKSTMKTEN
jgi:hypothetical protein